MARVFYVECAGEIWRAIARECATRGGWEPVLWTGGVDDEAAVRKAFPGVEYFAGPDAALNLIRPGWPPAAVPQAERAALAPAREIALQMMDRMDGGGFDRAAREAHYEALLGVWAGALQQHRPDRVVFSIAPHVVFDYVLYALCRLRNIPTLMFERHGLPGWVFTLEAIDAPSPALRRALERRDLPLPPAYARWLADQRAGAQAAVPPNFAKKLAVYRVKQGGTGDWLQGVAFEAKRAAVLLARHGFAGARNSYLRSARAPHGRARWAETECVRLRGLLAKRRLAAELDRLAGEPVEGEPYVLLALHYQPERSTVPMGGAFGDQQLVAEVLGRALPEGWKLYVKEHPWQLQPYGRGEMQRAPDYYARLARHANLRVMPMSVPTSDLIDGARAVATVSGSVGWQAMCRGVPALVFGEAWYRDCEGAFRIRGEADARAALAAVAAGRRVAPHAVERFAAALAHACVRGVLEPSIESVQNLRLEDAARSMAAALLEHSDQ